MAEFETGEDVKEGISLVISVSELDEEYWSSIEMLLPGEPEDIENMQFVVLLKGIEIARDKITELIESMENDDDDQ